MRLNLNPQVNSWTPSPGLNGPYSINNTNKPSGISQSFSKSKPFGNGTAFTSIGSISAATVPHPSTRNSMTILPFRCHDKSICANIGDTTATTEIEAPPETTNLSPVLMEFAMPRKRNPKRPVQSHVLNVPIRSNISVSSRELAASALLLHYPFRTLSGYLANRR